MRDEVEADLLDELLRRLVAHAIDGLGLVPQLVHAFLAGAADRLVGRNDDALDHGGVVQGLQHQHQLGGRAVRIGDDVLLLGVPDGVRIHFRHDQRHVRIHAPDGGVVDDDRTQGADLRRPFLGDGAAGAHQHDVDLCEVELFEVLAFKGSIAEGNFHALRFARGNRIDFGYGELHFFENRHHFATHGAGGADNGDPITHYNAPKTENATMRRAQMTLFVPVYKENPPKIRALAGFFLINLFSRRLD